MAWSAAQYVKFEDERTRPARDLLVERFGAGKVTGLDSDENMLAAARKRIPGTEFLKADLNSWKPGRAADLFYANAVFQ